MAGRIPNPVGFDTSEKVNSNTLKRHPKMDLSRTDLLQLLSYLEGELQARDVVIATLKAEKAKQLLYQAKYGRFGLGDPFSAMQRDSDNMKDDTFDESAIKSMYDNQLAQLENLIATQRKAQLKMREQMLACEKKYQKVCSELDGEKRKHAQDTAQGDDVTYMLEKERERLNKEVDFEKANVKKMEKDLKKTLASLEDERANSAKHKQVALMLIKERRKLVEKLLQEKQKADEIEKLLVEEKNKSMNMAEGLVQESKKSLKMEATMERQASEFDLEREQLKNKLLREENKNKELQAHIESLTWQLENVHNIKPVVKDAVHTVEIKSTISGPQSRLSSERTPAWNSSAQTVHTTKPVGNIVEREAGLTPRATGDVSVRKRDNVRYASPQSLSVERGNVQYGDSNYETRVGPIGAVADSKHVLDHKLNVSVSGPSVVSSGGRITVQTNNPTVSQGPISPRRTLTITRGTPPPIPPNKPSFPVTTTIPAQKSSTIASTSLRKDDRLSGSKPVHIPVSVVHTSTVSASPSQRAPSHEGSPSSLRKPAQFCEDSADSFTSDLHTDQLTPPTSESFDFLGPEMADLQQLLVSMVSVPSNSPGIDSRIAVESMSSSSSPCSGSIAMSSSNVPISVTSSVMTSSNTSVNMTSSVTSLDDHSMTYSSNGIPQVLTESVNTATNDMASSPLGITPLVSPIYFAWMNKNFAKMTSQVSSNVLVHNILPLDAFPKELENNVRSPQVITPIASKSMASTSQPIVAVMTSSMMSPVVSSLTSAIKMSPVTSSMMQPIVSSPGNANNMPSMTSSVMSPVISSPASAMKMSPMTSSVTSQQKTLVTSNISIRPATTSTEPQQKLSTMLVLPETLPVEYYNQDVHSTNAVNAVTRMSAQMAVRSSYENSQPYVHNVYTRTPEQRMHERFLPASPIHRYAAMGIADALRKLIVDLEADVNLPMKDGTTPAHCAAENGQEDCLRLLLGKGCHVNSLRDDQQTPVHCSATFGHTGCLKRLLEKGGNSNLADQYGWSPLHWAANNGHLEACRLLLSYGARRLVYSNNMWSPLHMAVQSDWSEILELLLTFESSQSEKASHVQLAITQIVDKNGQTLSHIAACKQSQKCLSVILAYCDIDYDVCDRWGRTVLDIASPACMQILDYYANSRTLNLSVEVQCSGPAYSHADPYLIGRLLVHPTMHWGQLDHTVSRCFEEYLGQLDKGLCTKKTMRLDPEGGNEESQFTLGLTVESIDGYSIGNVFWRKSEAYPAVKLQDILFDQQEVTVSVILKGSTNDLDSLAFDLLLPKPFIESYIRLLEQYKCVVFYGPEGTRKKQLVKRLSRYLAEKERQRCGESRLSQVYLHRDFKHRDFENLLKTEGCLLPVDSETGRCSLLVLFHLEKVNLAQMLGSFTDRIDNRGGKHSFSVQGSDGVHEFYYFPENFYLIATMDKPRSTGLDLNLQQRFRWVHFRISNEPIKNLLGRHMLRRLLHTYGGEIPSPEESLFKVVEWILCVWYRVNHGANKLGLVDVVLGPDIFLPCPLESKSSIVILDWLKRLWNDTVAPAVHEAILKGAGKDSTVEGQQKVANTALYVLMQRAIVPGCPLNGQEKEDFLHELSGSNELNVPLKTEKINFSAAMAMTSKHSVHNGNHRNSENQVSAGQNRNSTGKPYNSSRNTASPSSHNFQNNSMPKRRTHLERPTNQNEDIEIPVIHDPIGSVPSNIEAKVPKLEIRSPLLGLPISLTNTFPASDRSSSLRSSLNAKTSSSSVNASFSQQRSTFSSTQSRIPQLSLSASTYKRSRSSENLSLTDQLSSRQEQKEATSPFSFSLTTPNTSLFSFKMFDKGNERKPSKSRSLSSSPTSLLYPRSLNRR